MAHHPRFSPLKSLHWRPLARSAQVAGFDTAEEANAALMEIIADLKPAAFAHQQIQNMETFDVYGVRWGDRSWYLKFTVREEEVVFCMSLHPPIRPLKTVGGIIK